MEWITKIINKDYFTTHDEALSNALYTIDDWCKQNNFDYKIKHNDETGCNRVLFFGKYCYKFIISSATIETDEIEEYYNIFFDDVEKRNKTKIVYYAHLEVN